MKNIFSKSLMTLFLMLLLTQSAISATTLYSIRVDGLACPYCAYGIEKKLNQLVGVKFIDMDLEKGIVTAEAYDIKLSESQLKQLFQDAGFTYRSMQKTVQ